MHQNIQLIAFDLDGTLIDTMGCFADIAGKLLNEYFGWRVEYGRQRYLETSGIPFFQQLEVLLPQHRKNKEVASLFEKQKIASFMSEKISEKTVETLHRLKDLEIKTAISSNNYDPLVKEFVHRENVPVDLALGFKTDFFKGQPHFVHLQNYFKTSADRTVFIGDSLKDGQLAAQNNVKFIAKIGTFSENDFRTARLSTQVGSIYDIHEIMDVLENL